MNNFECLRFIKNQFSVLYCDEALLILWLGLGTKTLGKDLEKIIFWLKIPVLVTTNTARDVLMVLLKHCAMSPET